MASVIAKKVWSGSKGKARIWGASATVGRPLRRQFSRVLGLDFFNPAVLRVDSNEGSEDEDEDFIPPFFDSDGLNVIDLKEELLSDDDQEVSLPEEISLDEVSGLLFLYVRVRICVSVSRRNDRTPMHHHCSEEQRLASFIAASII